MAVGGAEVVVGDAVVVGQLDLCLTRLVAATIGHEGERVALLRALGGPHQGHAEDLGVEVNGLLQIADAQHSVQ